MDLEAGGVVFDDSVISLTMRRFMDECDFTLTSRLACIIGLKDDSGVAIGQPLAGDLAKDGIAVTTIISGWLNTWRYWHGGITSR